MPATHSLPSPWWALIGLRLAGSVTRFGRAGAAGRLRARVELAASADTADGVQPPPQSGDQVAAEAVRAVLAEHPPVSFASGSDGATLTLTQLTELVREAAAGAVRARREAEARNAAEDSQVGWELIQQALAAPGAEVPVEAGRWAGIARGTAVAWCWNLFQFERRGIAHPGSQVRHEAIQQLRTGGLPAVFGYPERARVLIAQGFTPESYRQQREALGERSARIAQR